MSLSDLLSHAAAGSGGAALVALARWLRGREARGAAEARAEASVEREREATGRHAVTVLSETNEALLARVAALEAQAAAREARSLAREERHQRELATARSEREACRRDNVRLEGLVTTASQDINGLKESVARLERELEVARAEARAAEALARRA